jgi:ribose transport system permease protein
MLSDQQTAGGAATAGHPPVPDAGDAPQAGRQRGSLLSSNAFWVSIVLLALWVLFSLITPHHAFFSVDNFLTMALDASELLLLSMGITFLLGAGQLDLSIGSNLILSSVVASKVITSLGGSTAHISAGTYDHLGLALLLGIPAGVATGAAFGLVNGLLVTRLKINSFIVTLATTGIGLGTSLVITHGTDVPYLPLSLQSGFGVKKLFGVLPLPVIVAAVIVGILWFVLSSTRFGMRTLAIGSSVEATERAGIRTDRHLVALFLLMGALAGLAAILDIARFGTTNVAGHQTDNLQAIAAAVIGGTALFGGVASIGGSIVGTLIPVTLTTGLILVRVDPFYQLIAIGVILIAAVYFQERRRLSAT